MLICVLRVSAVSKGSKSMRRALVIIIVLAVVVAASWFGYEQFGKAKAQAAPDYETVTIGRGDISSTVSATGSVLPEREANLNFQGAGTVAKVAVKAGDRIQAGQVLAELDTTDLELAIRQAEIGQRQTEGAVEAAHGGPGCQRCGSRRCRYRQRQDGLRASAEGIGQGSTGGGPRPGGTGARLAGTGAAGLRQDQGSAQRRHVPAVAAASGGDDQLRHRPGQLPGDDARRQRVATGGRPGPDRPGAIRARPPQARRVGCPG